MRGSILDADPPAQGVKIARRMTQLMHDQTGHPRPPKLYGFPRFFGGLPVLASQGTKLANFADTRVVSRMLAPQR
jgi:hypothetical protein